MADDTLITGTTVGDISYVVAYYDVNTGNLYDANGNMYGNSTLTTTLDNEFILELHYVQDISTDSDPTTWAVWGGLEGKTVDSSLAFDSDYKHAYEGASTESTAAASHEIKITVSSVDKDTLNSEGNLIINPYGLEPEQIPQGSTATPRMVVPYDSFEYVSSNTSGTVFKFHVADPDGLMYAVPANIQVRVSDPLYLYINPSSIYEVNIPPRYNEGVFKFPMNIMSRKLLKALDYTGVSGVVGTLEHKISVRRDTLTGVSYNSNTYTRDKDKDSTAVYSGDTFLFCAWVNGSSTIWTKGNDVQTNTAVYSISNGTATLLGSTANPVTETDSVLFRTFAFPFLVKNLIDYNATIDIPMQDVDWAKDYIISIIKNNMEEVTGKASTGAYGVVKIANDGTIDVDDGVISIATSLATKQDNMSATAPVAINNSTVSLNFGDGLDVGVTGTTNANKLIVNEASVKEVLEDVVDGGTEPAVNEIVTADNLRGALSVGQAVDVSCAGRDFNFIQYSSDSGTTWNTLNKDSLKEIFISDFCLRANYPSSGSLYYGFSVPNRPFPKFASGLSYLYVVDVKVLNNVTGLKGSMACYANGSWIYGSFSIALSSEYVRLYVKAISAHVLLLIGGGTSGSDVQVELKNWRQYEVTALTDEAIAYIAQLEDPDAFFRSTSAYSIRNKYLIKQDMVCPFIPTIEMSNSDLTVAAGLSYKMTYKSNTATTHTITADTIPTLAYGWDTHLQLFVDDNTTVNFQSPLVLEDPLTPNAGHNMTIKWRNGQALAYVDDTDVGYIVTVTAGTENGSLYYGLTNDVGEYITFANTTDGQSITIDDAAILTRNINVIGNGTDNTEIYVTTSSPFRKDSCTYTNFSISCAITSGELFMGSKIMMDNVRIHDVNVTAPTHIFWLSNGCVVRNSEFIDLTAFVSNNIGVFYSVYGECIIENCKFKNISPNNLVAIRGYYTSTNNKTISIKNCLFEECYALVTRASHAEISGCTFATSGANIYISHSDGSGTFSGTNILNSTVSGAGSIILSTGTTLTSPEKTGKINLSGNTNYLTNDLGTITIDGLTITNGLYFGIYIQNGNVVNLTNCNVTGNTVGDAFIHINSIANISGGTYGIVELDLGATLNLSGRVNVRKNITGRGLVNLADNTIIDCTGNTNTSVILMGAGSIGDEGAVIVGSGCKVVTSGGSTVSITGGTYYSINNASNAPTTAQAPYVYGYATVKDSGVYVPVELQNGVVTQVDALVLSRMSCHDARIALMDDCATRHIKYYVKPNDLTKKLDGTASKLDGTDGDVMTEFPKSHFLYTENGTVATSGGNDTKDVVLMSRSAFTYNGVDSDWHKSFYISPDGNTVRNQFMGYYLSYVDESNKMRSISGVYPRVNLRLGSTYYSGTTKVTNTNNPSYLKYAGNNGGTNCNRLHYEWLYHLLITKELTIDTQSISLGFCYMSGTAWSNAYPRLTGYSNQVDFYGGQTFANDNDKDIEAMWNGCSITSNSLVWGTSPDKLQFTTSGNTRTVTAFGWRNGTSPNFSYVYTKFEDGMPQIGDTCYSDASCTVEYGTITAVNTGIASSNRVTSCKYFIENPWSNLWQNQAGYVPIVTTGGVRTTAGFYRTTAINSYETILTFDKNTTDATAQIANVEYIEHPWATANNYVITWNPVTFHALTTGAYGSSKMRDYLYIVNTVDVPRCGLVGGYAFNATSDGLGCEHVYSAVGYSSARCVGRLSA